MLAVDMVGRSEADLEKMVAERCSPFGPIAHVRVVRTSRASGFAIALVRMAAPGTLEALIAGLGAAKSGSTAIIRLEQEQVLD